MNKILKKKTDLVINVKIENSLLTTHLTTRD